MNLANRISIVRIVLVPVFVAALLYYSPERPHLHLAAILLYVGACLSDALDGYLARKRGEITALGSYIDPIADKLLLLSGFLSLSLIPTLPSSMHMPAWVTLSVLSRDVLIVTGAMIIFVTTGSLKSQPLVIGKITTVVQMGALFTTLMGAPEMLRFCMNVLTVAFTVLSGVLYVRMGSKMLQES